MSTRIHCDGCGERLHPEALIATYGKRKVAYTETTNGGATRMGSEFVEFHLCRPCTDAAFKAAASRAREPQPPTR